MLIILLPKAYCCLKDINETCLLYYSLGISIVRVSKCIRRVGETVVVVVVGLCVVATEPDG